MIPRDYVTEWRAHAPWVLDRQVEQDLVISRALVKLFSRSDPVFSADLSPLLAHGHAWDFEATFDRVCRELVALLPGQPWKGPEAKNA
jgi:hypothetical protein